jgi:hypothetical protein
VKGNSAAAAWVGHAARKLPEALQIATAAAVAGAGSRRSSRAVVLLLLLFMFGVDGATAAAAF